MGISVVGLNGEQLLDSVMTVKIRDDYFLHGNKGSGIAKQAITLVSALLALLSTSFSFSVSSLFARIPGLAGVPKKKASSTTTFILIWATAQFIRVFFFSDSNSSNEFIHIIGLILLDKYTGTLGEIALEQSLLNYLHARAIKPPTNNGTKNPSLAFSMLWLMAVYGFVEDFTQGLCRKLVRVARKVPPPTSTLFDKQFLLFAFWQNRSFVICCLVCITTLFVLYNDRKKIKKA
eukprot:Phypoly_transcript_17479.p1 GENE.Phypoly_transcript_17479~~Phypoly_transcript_17479.p1  ORF type:complete len:263 (+),score=20.62 Phypoly_transcript_17479:88-789(+)